VNNNFEDFSEDECSDRCLKPCVEVLLISFQSQTQSNLIRISETNRITYINNAYITFTYFMSAIGGLLGLWNNVSFNDLQLIFIKIYGKIFKLKLITKLSKYIFSTKILKSFDFIRSFVIKINLKVKKIFTSKILFQIYIINIILGIANDCNGYYSHNTNNFIHS
jgi:hypothetical protein